MQKIIRITFLTALSLLFSTTYILGQLTTDNTTTPEEGVDLLLGDGILVSNISFSGDDNQIGSFECNNCGINMESGVVIATGDVVVAEGPNDASGASEGGGNGGASDPDLEIAEPEYTFNDAAVLEFDFVAAGDSVQFNYVFASEEYPEFIPSAPNVGFNDTFGFFLSGPGINGEYTNDGENIAQIPGTELAVNIFNLNNGDDGVNGPCSNCQFYVNNWTPDSTSHPFDDIQFDGFTTVLEASASGLQCGETYHIKIAIADAGDGILDSGVFLEAGSFASNAAFIEGTGSINPEDPAFLGDTTIVEGCNNGAFSVFRSNCSTTDTLHFNIGGSATNGLDYTELPPFIVLDSGICEAQIPLNAIEDDIAEETENVVLQYIYEDACGNVDTTSSSLAIVDYTAPEFNLEEDFILPCPGDPYVLEPNITAGVGFYYFDWDTGDSSATISINPEVETTYTLTISDPCGTEVTDSVTVSLEEFPPLETNIPEDYVIPCPDDEVDITVDPVGGSPGYSFEWTWTESGAPQGASGQVITVSPEVTTEYEVTVTDYCGLETDTTVQVVVTEVPEIALNAPEFDSPCAGDEVEIYIEVEGGLPDYTYQWQIEEEGEVIGEEQQLVVQPIQPMSYIVTVTDACGRSAQEQVTVNVGVVEPIAGSDTIPKICTGSTRRISVSGGTGVYTFSSGFPNVSVDQDGDVSVSSSFVVPSNSDTTQVFIDVVDDCGNTGMLPVTISACDTHIPNIFTPNGDGWNDFYEIRGISDFPGSALEIRNRWGNVVFDTTDYQNNWDGRDNSGDKLSDGTYYYIFQRSDGEKFSGYIHISR